ncbi:MAG: hypothetical protein IJ418_21230 [Clostridia bacterium]|nr:hypothetical protein [Clostridia bacterium]
MRKKCRITAEILQKRRTNICFDRDFCFGNDTDKPEGAFDFMNGKNKLRQQNEQK